MSAILAEAACASLHVSCGCTNPGDIIAEPPHVFYTAIQAMKYIAKHKRWPAWLSQRVQFAICNNLLVFMCADAVVPCARGHALLKHYRDMPSPRIQRRDALCLPHR